ncbi:FHA domain-containing protein [Pseudomaricurvus sp. HS19]|uniref:FHA domain-containing protein n=1 Tax=Pseudomaricurvus sp. HS19 TaxID=2692626 RepID=UPI00136CBC30|nr:FHA domain-containing protein [Pseudomaricurvus sp. HS19]
MSKTALVAASFTGLLLSAQAMASSAYKVEVTDRDGKQKSGLATKVNDTDFVVDHKLLSSAAQVVLLDASRTPATRVIADIKVNDDDTPVAVISATGISGDAMQLAREPLQAGREVFLATTTESRPGVVLRLEPVKSVGDNTVYVHHALYSKGEWGAPLLNNCQALAGISLAEGSFLNSMKAPEQLAYALGTDELKALLDKHSVAYTTEADVCLSKEDQAALDLQKAEEEKAKAEAAVKAAASQAASDAAAAEQRLKDKEKALADAKAAMEKEQQRLKELQEQAEQTRIEAEQNRLEKEKAEALAKKVKEESDKKAEQEQQQKLILVAVAAAVIVLLLLIFLFVLARRKKAIAAKELEVAQQRSQAEMLSNANQQLNQELESAKVASAKTFSDILLNGVDGDGNPVKLKVSGKALAMNGEQSIGREAKQVDCVLTSEEISRQHLKLILRDDTLYVRDLGSFNGTYLNRNRLEPNQDVALPSGSKLALSTIELDVSYN